MSISGLKDGARRLMFENAPKLFFVSIIFIAITTVMSELIFRLPGTANAVVMFLERIKMGEIPAPNVFYTNLRYSGLALAAVIMLLQPVLEVGFMRYCVNTTRRLGGDYKDILDGFLFFIKVILIFIITTVFIFLWSIPFIFPGVAAHYRYRQAYYILLDAPEKGALQCIRESKRMMDGNKLDLFLVDLSFLGWIVLDWIVVLLLPLPFALPLISIWLTPYFSLTCAAYYDHLVNKLMV